ncbi:MAG: tRNA (N6-threonylcarbamoyladenosine(37)-N6)-methyltransferase TrmO [Pseudobdellovibrionaceae bacterium]
MAPAKIELSPIGIFHTDQVQPYEAGRQPDDFHSEGFLELYPGQNFEQALIGLEIGQRIWILFSFHHNPNWHPMVLPPRGLDHKVGVFGTRSPYRPNGIGMSCVKIKKIEKLKIYVEGADLLDKSPILDIKPYVAYADSFPGEKPVWLKDAVQHAVHFSEPAQEKLRWLESQDVTQFKSFLRHQLEYEPTNSRKKRVKKYTSSLYNSSEIFMISYRTWRALFFIKDETVLVENIFSGYSEQDFSQSEDPYSDKEIHRKFKILFPAPCE